MLSKKAIYKNSENSHYFSYTLYVHSDPAMAIDVCHEKAFLMDFLAIGGYIAISYVLGNLFLSFIPYCFVSPGEGNNILWTKNKLQL